MRVIWRAPEVRALLAALSPAEREALHEHELAVYRDPRPDFETRFPLREGEALYFVYSGPLFELVYRLDARGPQGSAWRWTAPSEAEDTLLILSAHLAVQDEAA
jgi:hypothetical protein